MTWHKVYVEQTYTMVYEVDPDQYGEPDASQERTAALFAQDSDRWECYGNQSLSVRYEGDEVVTEADDIAELNGERNAWEHVVTFRAGGNADPEVSTTEGGTR